MVNEKGMTILELLMGLSIMGMVLYAAGSLLVEAQKNSSTMERTLLKSQDSLLLESLLKKTISFSNFRVYALNGATTAETAFSRFIYPQNSLCADLSRSTVCRESTALIYATLDSKAAATTRAFCWVTPGSQLMVSAEIEDYLEASNPLIALTFPPAASLWTVRGSPSAININDLPAECFLHLDRSGGNYVTNNRRVLQVNSFMIPGATGSPSAQVRTKMAVNFPMDINRVSLYAAGLMPYNNTTAFALQNCQWRQNTLRCANNILTMQGIQKVQILQTFKYKLNANSPALKYQIVGGSVQRDASCRNPLCLPMRLNNNSPIPYSFANENLEQMDPSRFSGIKQENLRRIDFLLTDDEGKKHSVNMLLD